MLVRQLFYLIILLAVPAFAQPNSASISLSGSALVAWQDSLRLERSGEYAKSIASLQSLPATYAVELRRGWLHYLNTNHVESAGHYRTASAAAPRAVEPRLGLLLPLLASARYGEAEFVSREILLEHKTHYLAHVRLATALRLQQKNGAADRVLARALRLYPSDVPLLTEMGLVKAARNELAAARYYFSEAATLDPENDVAFRELASPRLFADLATYYTPTGPGFARPAGFNVGATAARFDAVAYSGWIDYSGSAVKERAVLAGIAGWLGFGAAHMVEGGFDFIDITRKDGTQLHQHDLTVAYANYSLPNLKFRAGTHFLLSDDAGTDGSSVFFGGVDYYIPGRWNTGVDATFTRYEDYTPRLEVIQLAPHFGWTVLQGAEWSLRSDVKVTWIRLGADVGLGKQNFFSAEERVSFYWRQLALGAFGWAGRQAFGVRGDGAVAFNLAEKHTAGYGAELKVATSARTALALRYSREEFREFGASSTAAANTFLAFLGISF